MKFSTFPLLIFAIYFLYDSLLQTVFWNEFAIKLIYNKIDISIYTLWDIFLWDYFLQKIFYFNFQINLFVKFQNIRYYCILYSKLYRKSVLRNRLKLCHRKIVIAKIRRGKLENFTLNSYILDNFTYNMEQPLDSGKGR